MSYPTLIDLTAIIRYLYGCLSLSFYHNRGVFMTEILSSCYHVIVYSDNVMQFLSTYHLLLHTLMVCSL